MEPIFQKQVFFANFIHKIELKNHFFTYPSSKKVSVLYFKSEQRNFIWICTVFNLGVKLVTKKNARKNLYRPLFFSETTFIKMMLSIKGFFSKGDQIHGFLRICSHLLKKSLMVNFTFCAVIAEVSLYLKELVSLYKGSILHCIKTLELT